MSFRRALFKLVAILLCCLGAPALAEQWPSRAIKIVVPYAPGGTIDIVARQLSKELTLSLGQPVFVDNKAGAGGTVGTEYVARQPADGYTVLLTTVSHTLTPSLQKLSFDAENAFLPVIHISNSAQVLFKSPSFPASALKEVIQLAKKKPGALTYAHGGFGSPANIAAELLKAMAGVDIVGVPYRGAGPVMTAVLGNDVSLGIASQPAVQSFISAGTVVALGVSTKSRSQSLPDIPTFAEQGITGYEFNTWFGFLVANGTRADIIRRLAEATDRALQKTDVKEMMIRDGSDPVGGGPEEFDLLLKAEFRRWPKELKAAGITGE